MSNGKSKTIILIVLAVVVGTPMLLVCGLIFWLYVKTFTTQSKRPEIEQILAKAETNAREMDARWRKAMQTAGESRVRREVCSVPEFRIPPRGAMKKALGLEGASGPDLDQVMRNAASADAKTGASNARVVHRSQLLESKSPMALRAAYLVRGIRSGLDDASKEHDELLVRANALIAPSFWTRDLTVVIDLKLDPKLDKPDASTFQGGAAHGLAYVFDYQQQEIVCVAEFFSENSAMVEFAAPKGAPAGINGNMAISDDLEANILESAKRALYRTGPGTL